LRTGKGLVLVLGFMLRVRVRVRVSVRVKIKVRVSSSILPGPIRRSAFNPLPSCNDKFMTTRAAAFIRVMLGLTKEQ